MAKYKEISSGLIIELPEEPGHVGVVLDTTRLNKEWYKVSVVCQDGDLLVCKLKLRADGEYLDHKDSVRYDTQRIVNKLSK